MRTAVFAGTSDGRRLARELAKAGDRVTVFTATEYGAALVEGLDVRAGRLGEAELRSALRGFDAAADATHPYAKEITKNLREVCAAGGIPYFRLTRDGTNGGTAVDGAAEAAEYLRRTNGAVFAAIGSKELAKLEPIGARVTARVLDTPAVRGRCEGLNIRRLFYRTPPFSLEDNLVDFSGCRYLITKDSGREGGTPEKLAAARRLGMEVIMIRRPDDEGLPFWDLIRALEIVRNDIDNRRGV